jgi:hypothetical protein
MAKKKSPFDASMFTATQFDSAEDKATFGNHLLAFIEADFPESKFTKAFYNRLINTFGFIAHYDRDGFWSTFFTNTVDKIQFLQQLIEYPRFCSPSPEHTFSDVERAVRVALLADGTLALYQAQNRAEIEQAELSILARLKAKYEAATAPAVTGERIPSLAEFISAPAPVAPKTPTIQGLLF